MLPLDILTTPWNLVLGVCPVSRENRLAQGRGAWLREGRAGYWVSAWDAGTLDKNHICSSPVAVHILPLMKRTRQFDPVSVLCPLMFKTCQHCPP